MLYKKARIYSIKSELPPEKWVKIIFVVQKVKCFLSRCLDKSEDLGKIFITL